MRSVLFFTIVALALIAFAPQSAFAATDNADSSSEQSLAVACATLPGPVTVGQQTIFAAGSAGGEGEVTYEWSGAVGAEGQFVRPTFQTAGVHTLYLTGEDEEGETASARCALFVEEARTGTPAQTGVGGAPGTVGHAPTNGASGTTGQAGEDTAAPPADGGVDGGDVDIAEDVEDIDEVLGEDEGTSTGRIILWVVIVLIVISLIVLFWRRYNEEHGDGGGAGKSDGETAPRDDSGADQKTAASSEPDTAQTDEDDVPPFTEQDEQEAQQTDSDDESIIIPPAR